MGTRFLLTKECPVPEAVKAFYLAKAVTDTVVTTQGRRRPAPRAAHRVRRQARAARRGRPACSGRSRNALAFRQLCRDPAAGDAPRGPRDAQDARAHLGPGAHGGEHADAAARGDGRGRTDYGVMASGQVVGVIDDLPAWPSSIARIVREAEATLDRLSGRRRSRPARTRARNCGWRITSRAALGEPERAELVGDRMVTRARRSTDPEPSVRPCPPTSHVVRAKDAVEEGVGGWRLAASTGIAPSRRGSEGRSTIEPSTDEAHAVATSRGFDVDVGQGLRVAPDLAAGIAA